MIVIFYLYIFIDIRSEWWWEMCGWWLQNIDKAFLITFPGGWRGWIGGWWLLMQMGSYLASLLDSAPPRASSRRTPPNALHHLHLHTIVFIYIHIEIQKWQSHTLGCVSPQSVTLYVCLYNCFSKMCVCLGVCERDSIGASTTIKHRRWRILGSRLTCVMYTNRIHIHKTHTRVQPMHRKSTHGWGA